MELRGQILDASREVLLRSGYERLSMRRIAKMIGVSATSIYLYYENKDAIFQALVDEGMQRLFERLSAAQEQAGDLEHKLDALSRAYIHFGLENREYYEIMFVMRPRNLERFPSENFRRARRSLEMLVELAQDAHSLPRQEALLLATSVWSQLHGAVSLLNAQRVDARIEPEALVERTISNVTRDFREAVAPPANHRKEALSRGPDAEVNALT